MLDDFKWDDSMREDFPTEQEFNQFIDAIKFFERYQNANKTLVLDKERYKDVLRAYTIAIKLFPQAEVEIDEKDPLDLGSMYITIRAPYQSIRDVKAFSELIAHSNGFEVFHNDITSDIEINIDFARVFKLTEIGDF